MVAKLIQACNNITLIPCQSCEDVGVWLELNQVSARLHQGLELSAGKRAGVAEKTQHEPLLPTTAAQDQHLNPTMPRRFFKI